MMENPIVTFARYQGVMVLDGGLATALEAKGCDLDDPLWSAKILLEDPEAILQVHLEFLAAGADCIATSTYQATIEGFRNQGMSDREAVDMLRRSVDLAVEARDEFWSLEKNREGRLKPLVAASVGPYGAYLADGSEYRGDYGIDDDAMYAFHHARWHVLADTPADLMACETIPSAREAVVLTRLLRETPDIWAWLSFSCRDGRSLNDGTGLAEVVEGFDAEPRIAAVGINCTSPEHISSLIMEARTATQKPVIVYPNSGERYDTASKTWVPAPFIDWEERVSEWARSGATGIGGCCRIRPAQISQVRRRLVERQADDGGTGSRW